MYVLLQFHLIISYQPNFNFSLAQLILSNISIKAINVHTCGLRLPRINSPREMREWKAGSFCNCFLSIQIFKYFYFYISVWEERLQVFRITFHGFSKKVKHFQLLDLQVLLDFMNLELLYFYLKILTMNWFQLLMIFYVTFVKRLHATRFSMQKVSSIGWIICGLYQFKMGKPIFRWPVGFILVIIGNFEDDWLFKDLYLHKEVVLIINQLEIKIVEVLDIY